MSALERENQRRWECELLQQSIYDECARRGREEVLAELFWGLFGGNTYRAVSGLTVGNRRVGRVFMADVAQMVAESKTR